MRIAQLANFHSPTSGGLRVAVDTIGHGYLAAGHERLLIVPGPVPAGTVDDTVVTVPSVDIPRTPYRLVVRRRPVLRALEAFAPDRVEVSDKVSLRWVGDWARRHGVESVLITHERLDAVAGTRPWSPGAGAARRWTNRWARAFDAVVAPSQFAADEFRAVGADPVVVPWGVDLEVFAPRRVPVSGAVRIAWVGRFSAEKRPWLAVETLRALVDRGVDARLFMIGDGPMRPALQRRVAGLPVHFVGRIADRIELATILAGHHVCLATGPAETFNLSALEALACGVPVVGPDAGATRELLDEGCGRAVPAGPDAFAAAAIELVAAGVEARSAARRRSAQYPWSAAVEAMLGVHCDRRASV